MALITRISRLFTADLHAVLDRMEEPEIVLKQAIRDMREAVAAGQRQIRALEARAEQIAAVRASTEARLREAAEQLDVCLAAGNDDLARSVIQRRLQLERHLTDLTGHAEQVERSAVEQERALAQRQRELDVLVARAAVLHSEDRDGSHSVAAAAVSADEVEVALLREKQRRAQP